MNNLYNDSDFEFYKSLILEVGRIALDLQKSELEIERKSDSSIVTQVDTKIQELLIKEISGKYPGINFIHEENFDRTQASDISDDTISVIIDPIDGTAMYTMRLPIWCVSIGIFKGYTPLYGFVYSPGSDMLFYNDNDHSYLNNNIVTVDENIKIDKETNIFYASEIKMIYRINFPGKVRNLGSTALHACLTVDNKRNRLLAFLGGAFLWDWAAAIPIILKAKGHVRYINGKEVDYKKIIENHYLLTDYLLVHTTDDFESIQNIFQRIEER
ncbi:MAG: inositol monophosphatase family protein [bacterium]|nr:inositol monophosphatase family protein [bacterium]